VELICEEAAVIFSLHTALDWYFVSHVDLCIRLLLLNKIMFGRHVMDGRVWGEGAFGSMDGELGIMLIQHCSLRFNCFGWESLGRGGIWKYGELGIMPIQHRSLRFNCFGSN
jgi:hypothetical protein